jgi:agmatine deiminase
MAKRMNSTPKKDGFWMPGEFEPHEQTWMIWPERTDNWRLGAKPAQHAFVEVATAISNYEPVTMCVSARQYQNAREMLPANIRVVEMENNDFNAWGGLVDGLYFPWDKDDAVAQKMCEIENIDTYKVNDFVLEGGSIHVDGEGTCIVTEACLLSKGRNGHLSKEEIEKTLMTYLNVQKVIWLPNGIYLDETNEHVDNIIQIVKPGEVILAWTDDETDPQYEMSRKAYETLSNSLDAKGRPFKIYKLHIPNEVLITKEESEGVDKVDGTLPRVEGDRQAASYANFYIVNGAVIYPTFNDEKYDTLAQKTLEKAFPDRDVVGVYAREIILGGGNIHCITQQQPRRKK